MGLFDKLANDKRVTTPAIDWDLVPADTFAIFESWGGSQRIKSRSERSYYFFIDGWQEPAVLCLMERGVKYAKVLARIRAPQDLIAAAVAAGGRTKGLDRSYAITDEIKAWLMANLFDSFHEEFVTPLETVAAAEAEEVVLAEHDTPLPADLGPVALPREAAMIQEEEVAALAASYNLYDSRHNPQGEFANFLVDNNDGLTVTDKVTGLMWQRGGCDLTAIRRMKEYVARQNGENFAGYGDWRLPTMEEALSLMEPQLNQAGTHTHPCFSAEQPFIFVAAQRHPGGYWFCDYKQATVFWASGTIPGGFGRLCRTI
ncbi:MAG: DUF1566 domain-containing protein [Thermodesulfobacteriota bacterium]